MIVHTEIGNPLWHFGIAYSAIYRHGIACPVCQRVQKLPSMHVWLDLWTNSMVSNMAHLLLFTWPTSALSTWPDKSVNLLLLETVFQNFRLQVVFCMSAYSYSELTYNRVYKYPQWSIVIGWMMACLSVTMIPIIMAYKLFTTEGTLYEVGPGVVVGLYEIPGICIGVCKENKVQWNRTGWLSRLIKLNYWVSGTYRRDWS